MAAEITNSHKAHKEASADSVPDSLNSNEPGREVYLDNHSTRIKDKHLVAACKAIEAVEAGASALVNHSKTTILVADNREAEADEEVVVEANRTTKVSAADNKTTLEEVSSSQHLVGLDKASSLKEIRLALGLANSRIRSEVCRNRIQVASVRVSNKTSLNRTSVDSALVSRCRTRISQRSVDSVQVYNLNNNQHQVKTRGMATKAVAPRKYLASQFHKQTLQVRVEALELDRDLANQTRVQIYHSPFQ